MRLSSLGIPTLTDLAYENAANGLRHAAKKPKGGELTQDWRTFNAAIRSLAELANALLKATFKASRQVSLDLKALTRTVRAAFVLLQLEHGRTA